MKTSVQERLDDLETRFAFLDDTLSQLLDVDAHQARRLLRLEDALHALRTELSLMRTALGDNIRDEPPPPHY